MTRTTDPYLGPPPQHKKPWRTPLWAVLLLWGTAVVIGFIVVSVLPDARGNDILDDNLVKVLLSVIGVVGTLMTLLIQNQKSVEHEMHPNSGSTARDAIDRIERLALQAQQTAEGAKLAANQAVVDTRELREDVQQVRTDMGSGFQSVNTNVNHIIRLLTPTQRSHK